MMGRFMASVISAPPSLYIQMSSVILSCYRKTYFIWFLSQSTDCETKGEYDRSHKDLTKFLNPDESMRVIGDYCVNSITTLQDNLQSKEYAPKRNKLHGCIHYISCRIQQQYH